jgi:hypothetical protein
MQQRIIVYVCSAIKDGKLISKMIETKNTDEARSAFEKEYAAKPEAILGPFYKKKTAVLTKNCDIRFKSDAANKRGIYNDWYVSAMPLETPADSFYIFYDKRVDGEKLPKPNIVIIKSKELKETQ